MISIKMYRGKAGLTQSQLAELIGVPRTYLATLEKSDYHLVPKSNVLKIAEVLNISAIELFGIDNLKIKPKNNEEIKQLIKILLSELKEDDKNEFIKEMEKL